jgi:DNA repair exonuclease SbcCD ATPase subunit
MNPHPRTNPTDLTNTLEAIEKTIHAIKTHRKKRHGKLREMTRDEEDGRSVRATWGNGGDEGVPCPVCGQGVRGDRDVMEAHVDSCLAHECRRLEEASRAEEDVDIDINGADGVRLRATDEANLRGQSLMGGELCILFVL